MAGLKETPQDVKDHVRRRFGDVAANYRSSKVHASGPDLDRMIDASRLSRETRALDAGCGAGHAALAFAKTAGQVFACDFTPAMLAQARSLARDRGLANLRAQLADVEQLPYASDSFDLIATRYSAHHWPRPERALAEFRRLLKTDGIVLVSDIMAREDYAQDTFLQTIELLRDPSHARDYRISEWQAMLTRAGFGSEILMQFDLTLHFETWTRRMNTPKQNADMIKSLFNSASADIRRAFRLPARVESDDFEFVIPGAVIRATITQN